MRDCPVDLLAQLFGALTEAGATAECVRIQEDLAVALPASVTDAVRGDVLYDLACLYCRDGRVDDARATLAEALHLQPSLAGLVAADPDLERLRV
jgi:hypothetical protein